MRHLKKGKKFSRVAGTRRALMKSLAASFFVHGRIVTTEAKARALRPYAERLITRARRATLSDRRVLDGILPRAAAHRAIADSASMRDRSGGYTRIIKTGPRRSDSARMAILEWVTAHSS